MAAPLLQAINQAAMYGYTAIQTLNFLGSRFQQLKNPIKQAQRLGHKAEDVLEFLSGKQNFKGDNEFRKTQRGLGYTEKGERLKKGLKIAATAIPLAAAGYGAARAAFARNQAIHPSAILPPLPRQQMQRALPGPQQPRGLPAPGPRAPGPQAPTNQPPPAPLQQPPAPTGIAQPMPSQQQTQTQPTSQAQPSEMPEAPELKAVQQKEADIGQLWDLAKKGKTQGNPFLKTTNHLIKNGTIKNLSTFTNFRNWWQATEGKPRSNPLVEFEKFRTETRGMFEDPTKSVETDSKSAETFAKGDRVQLPSGKKATVKDISQKVARVAREDGREAQYRVTDLKRLSEATPKSKEVSKALYQQPGEPQEEWENRKLIAQASKKAAKEIVQGKTFLDLPMAKELLGEVGSYSVAEDVLSFLAGQTNPYEPLLSEAEKKEMEEGLGAGSIYGATMTPNMVWNMLLSVEPKLHGKEIRPKSVKGKETIKGGKMGAEEFRRSLTHKVYGIISGKNISTELADKIKKLSGARSILDTFDEAFKQGKIAKLDPEMEKLMNDQYFNSLFTQEIEDMARAARGKKVTPSSAADTKSANVINKKMNEINSPDKIKENHGDKKMNSITQNEAQHYYEKHEIPPGWFVHGRADRQDLETGNVLQLTKDWEVGEQYAGRKGSLWLVKPTPQAKTLDLSNPNNPDMDKIVKKGWDQYKKHGLEFMNPDLTKSEFEKDFRESYSPDDIVMSAGAFDSIDMINWLWDNFGADFVYVKNGGIALHPETIEKIKINED